MIRSSVTPPQRPRLTIASLVVTMASSDVVVEGAFVRSEGKSARAYLAVPSSMTLEEVLEWLRAEVNWLDYTLAHPLDDAQATAIG